MDSASTACAPGPFGRHSFGADIQLAWCSGQTTDEGAHDSVTRATMSSLAEYNPEPIMLE